LPEISRNPDHTCCWSVHKPAERWIWKQTGIGGGHGREGKGRVAASNDIIPSRASYFLFPLRAEGHSATSYLRSGMRRGVRHGYEGSAKSRSQGVKLSRLYFSPFIWPASGRFWKGEFGPGWPLLGCYGGVVLTKFVLYECRCRSRGRSQMQDRHGQARDAHVGCWVWE
jgi:hypothetical protein